MVIRKLVLATSVVLAAAVLDRLYEPSVARACPTTIETEIRADSRSEHDRPAPHTGAFAASLFSFKTTLPDDGTDKGGGEQQASATLAFVDSRQDPPPAWICNVTIRMPLRTAVYGKVSASKAAEISAKVTTAASGAVMYARPVWQPTGFCKAFQDKMNDIFFFDYRGLGGRATANR